jgi:hypothetical protein
MKKYFSILLLFFLFKFSFAQPLQQGVFSTVILATDVRAGYHLPNCYSYEFDFYNGFSPYATGMNLYVIIDSIKGQTDSIKIWRSPDYLNGGVFRSRDTIPLINLNPIYISYFANDTLYASLVAIGMPQVAHERYYCNFSKGFSVNSDGCANVFTYFFGGNGPMDTAKNCSVSNPTGIVEYLQNYFEIYPNPSKGEFIIKNDELQILNYKVEIYNMFGQKIFQSVISNLQSAIDITSQQSGVYLLKINEDGKEFTKKLWKE